MLKNPNVYNEELKLTEIVVVLSLVYAAFIDVDENTPKMVDYNERRRQRRLVVILFRQTVSIEAPRLDADILHCLKRVAATTDQNHAISL